MVFQGSNLFFHCSRSVSGLFFMVSSGFSWFFKVPVFFCGFMSVLIVFQCFRLAFHGSRWVFRLFHGSRLVFIDPGRCSMILGGFFMAPGVFHGFSGFQVGFS